MINFIERKYLKNIFVYHKRLLLDSDATFVDELPNGDFCPAANGPRKAIVEYRCDKTGNTDILVNFLI